MALSSRLITTCSIRSLSAFTGQGSVSNSQLISISLASRSFIRRMTARRSISLISKVVISGFASSRSRRLSASRSSISPLSRLLSSATSRRYFGCSSAGITPSAMPSAKPLMLVIGLRSSWLTFATNSLRPASTPCSLCVMVLNAPLSSRSSRSPFFSSTCTEKSPSAIVAAAVSSCLSGFSLRRTNRNTTIPVNTVTTAASATILHRISPSPDSIFWARVRINTAPFTFPPQVKGTPTVNMGASPLSERMRIISPFRMRSIAALISSLFRLSTNAGSSWPEDTAL